jgi:hypothetical protein
MSKIEIGPDLVQIDADIVAKALKISPHDLKERMRNGTVTSRFERGEGQDAGRMRLTFFSNKRRARITADTSGTVLACTGVDFARPRMAVQPQNDRRTRMNTLLDDALQGTFPASDPVALGFDTRD